MPVGRTEISKVERKMPGGMVEQGRSEGFVGGIPENKEAGERLIPCLREIC